MKPDNAKLIDRWFPVAAVDDACGTPSGSGRVEKAIFTWFASRPIAQARAAALTSLLPDNHDLKSLIEAGIRLGEPDKLQALASHVVEAYQGNAPLVLDMFSGRGLIPLEVARAGGNAIGIDLSPVATLAGRLLADYPARDWSAEPDLPFLKPDDDGSLRLKSSSEKRLADDVAAVLAEVGRRVAARMEPYYPRNSNGQFPWGYVWTTTIPCDGCARRFPLIGSLTLSYPCKSTSHEGQSLRLTTADADWSADVIRGASNQQPTYASGLKSDGKKKKGKSARCLFCGFIHTLEAIKSKGFAGQYEDRLLLVADSDVHGNRLFRMPSKDELTAATTASPELSVDWPYSAVPDELIPPGNVHTVMASGYGYTTFGQLMCKRQALSFAITVDEIRKAMQIMTTSGVSAEYAGVLGAYAASTLCKRLRRSTRGVRILQHGSPDGSKRGYEQTSDLFSNEAKIDFQFDFFEVGPGDGAGSWSSVSSSAIRAIEKVLRAGTTRKARFIKASATALPLRDSSVDVVITDPPYYDMIEYADASDLMYVWLKRALFDVEPDLFSPDVQQPDGLQDKNQEIIVRRVHEPNRVRHDKDFYESALAVSFGEARRVLKQNGHLVVIFGHSDPDAWRRLLGALQTAGFVVTSAWPSRTETATTGVASIKVTVTIGCAVAATNRPSGMAAEVDREVVEAVSERVHQWDTDGLALEDQLMASYGPAMEVYGRYSRVINPDGSSTDLDHFLALARRAVRDAMRLRVDELPLETFDAITRFAIFWLRAKGRSEVPKGEARFFAQADELRLDDLRNRILTETKAGFQLCLSDEKPVSATSSTFEVTRAMAHGWDVGGMEEVARVMASAQLEPNNQHLWAVVGDLANHLPASDKMAKALAGIKRSSATISTLVGNARHDATQASLLDLVEK